jgi:hypothetical protein
MGGIHMKTLSIDLGLFEDANLGEQRIAKRMTDGLSWPKVVDGLADADPDCIIAVVYLAARRVDNSVTVQDIEEIDPKTLTDLFAPLIDAATKAGVQDPKAPKKSKNS